MPNLPLPVSVSRQQENHHVQPQRDTDSLSSVSSASTSSTARAVRSVASSLYQNASRFVPAAAPSGISDASVLTQRIGNGAQNLNPLPAISTQGQNPRNPLKKLLQNVRRIFQPAPFVPQPLHTITPMQPSIVDTVLQSNNGDNIIPQAVLINNTSNDAHISMVQATILPD